MNLLNTPAQMCAVRNVLPGTPFWGQSSVSGSHQQLGHHQWPLCTAGKKWSALTFQSVKVHVTHLHFIHSLESQLMLAASSPLGKLGRKFSSALFGLLMLAWRACLSGLFLLLCFSYLKNPCLTQLAAVISHLKFRAIFPITPSCLKTWLF